MNRITNPYIRHSRIANAAEPQAQLALVWANLQFAHSETRICNSEIKNKEE